MNHEQYTFILKGKLDVKISSFKWAKLRSCHAKWSPTHTLKENGFCISLLILHPVNCFLYSINLLLLGAFIFWSILNEWMINI